MKPSLDGFAAELRRKLDGVSVSARTIKITPVLDAGATRALTAELRARLQDRPIPVPIQPVLVPNAVRQIRSDLRSRFEANPVPATVSLRLAPGSIQRLRAEIRGAGITVPVGLAPTVATARATATSTASASADAGAQRATAAQRAARQVLQENAQTARAAQRATRGALEEELVALRRLTTERAQQVKETQRAVLQGAATEQDAAAVSKAALTDLTRAERRLVEAQEFGVQAVTKSFEVQQRRARQNVEGARAAEASATAYRSLADIDARLTALQVELAAALEKTKAGLLTSGEVANFSKAAKAVLADTEKTLAVATEGGVAAQKQSAEAHVAAAEGARAETRALGSLVTAQEAATKQTQAQIVGTNEMRILRDELRAATTVDVATQRAYNEALASGEAALIAYTQQMKDLSAARAADAAQTVRDAEAQRVLQASQRPFISNLDRINKAILRNEESLGSRRTVTNAINLQARALDLQAKAAQTSSGIVTKALRAEIDAAVLATTEFRTLAEAEFASAAAAKQTATTRSAATRGVVATAASFLGLRGAVLSSTLPFLAATIAVTAFGKTLAASGEVQAAMNSFQAATGATADQMDAAAKEAQKLGADVNLPATSAANAATAMTELAKAGLSVKDSLAAARGTVQLAAAANIQAGDAAQIVASQLNAFQLAGSEASKVTDLLAASSIMAQGEITDFAQAFKQSATVAHQAGLSINQTTALLTQLARAGLQGSDAGTSLRVMLLRLVPVSKAAAEEMHRLGVAARPDQTIGEQLPDLIDRYREALGKLSSGAQTRSLRTIFGQDAIRAATILLGQNSAALQDLIAQQGKGGYATRLTEARAKGLTGALDGTSSAISTLAANIGSILSPAAESIVREFGRIAEGANKVVSAVKPLFELTKVPFTLGLDPSVVLETGAIVAAGLKLQSMQKARSAASAAEAEQIAANDAAIAAAQESRIVVDNEKTVVTEQNAAKRAATSALESAGIVGSDGAIVKAQVSREVTEREVTSVVEAETAKRIALAEAEAIATAGANARIGASATARGAAEAASSRGRLGGLLGGGLRGRLGNLSVAGLIGGVVAQQAGSTVGGTAGSILGTAGLGASVGAFFGVPGALIGAAGGAAVGGLEAAIAAHKRNEARDRSAFEAKWNSMSFDEQRAVLDDIARSEGKSVRGAPFRRSAQQVAAFQNAAIRRFLSEHHVRLKRDPSVTAQIPALQDLLARSNQQFATAASGAVTGATGLGPGPSQSVPGLGQIDVGRLLAPQPQIASASAAVGARVGPTARLQLQALSAQQRNDTAGFVDAIRTLLRRRQADLRRLQAAIVQPGANTKDLAKRIKQAFQDIAGFQQDIDNAISGMLDKFTPALGRLQLSQAQATLTQSAADDAAIAARITDYYEGRLKRAEKLARGTKNRVQLINAAQQQVLQARQQEQQAQQALIQEIIGGSAALQANTLASAQAGLTETLTDDLQRARERLLLQQRATAEIARMVRAGTATTRDLNDALLAQVAAQQDVSGLQKQIADTMKQQREDLISAQQGVVEAQTNLAETIRSGQDSITSAVQQAKQNLSSLGQTLASSIAGFIDKAGTGGRKRGALDARFRELRDQLLAGGGDDRSRLAAQTISARLQARDVARGDTSNVTERLQRRLADLTFRLNQRSITFDRFSTQLDSIVRGSGATPAALRSRLGVAGAAQFQAQVQGLRAQARAELRGPQRPGTGFEADIVEPLKVAADAQRQDAAAQKRLTEALRVESVKQTALLRSIRDNVKAGGSAVKVPKRKGSEKAADDAAKVANAGAKG